MSDNISIETINDAPTIVEVNATVVEEVINVEATESPDAPIVEVHVDENSAQAAIDAAALAQSILDNINDVIANMPVPTLQSVSESGAITDQVLSMAGLILNSKLNIVTSLITALRSVSFQDKDGVVALISDITALSQTIASKQSAELLLSNADVVQSGGMPQISGLTIQGHTLVIGSRVVVTGYNVPAFNGIYRVSTGPIVNTGHYILARTSDANTSSALNNAIISITNGTQSGKTYRQSAVNPTIGTTAINFVEFGGSTVANATDSIAGILKIYNALGSNLDGSINQKIISDNFALKFNSADICIKSLLSDISMNTNVQLNTNLTFPVEANERWLLLLPIVGGCTSSGGTRFMINAPSGSSGGGGLLAPAQSQSIGVNVAATATALGNSQTPVLIFCVVRVGVNSGNVTFSFASNSPGQTSFVRANSSLIAIKTTLS